MLLVYLGPENKQKVPVFHVFLCPRRFDPTCVWNLRGWCPDRLNPTRTISNFQTVFRTSGTFRPCRRSSVSMWTSPHTLGPTTSDKGTNPLPPWWSRVQSEVS